MLTLAATRMKPLPYLSSVFMVCSTLLLHGQVDRDPIFMQAVDAEVKYECIEVARADVPKRVIVLNCEQDTIGVWNATLGTSEPAVIILLKPELHDFDYSIESSCEFKHGIRNGFQKDYYDFDSVQDVCIKAHPFLKLKGEWKKGLRHGKWIYYNPDGTLLKVEKYRKDQLRTHGGSVKTD